MKFLKTLWQTNKDFRVLCFNIFNALIAFVGVLILKPELAPYSPFLVPVLNMLTKWINNKYFGDLGVIKS